MVSDWTKYKMIGLFFIMQVPIDIGMIKLIREFYIVALTLLNSCIILELKYKE